MEDNTNDTSLQDALAEAIMNPKPAEVTPPTEEVTETEEESTEETDIRNEDTEEAPEEVTEETEETEEQPEQLTDVEVLNELIQTQYAEFGVKSADELKNTLTDYQAKIKEVEELKTKLEAKSDFANDHQKKLFEYVSKYDGNDIRGFEDFVRLKTLDIDALDAKSALREAYILENKHLSREDNLKRFNREYQKKYEMDEEDKVYEEGDAKLAKEKLRKMQSETAATNPKSSESDTPDPSKIAFEKSKVAQLRTVDSLNIEMVPLPTVEGVKPFNYGLYPEEQHQVKELLKNYVNNPVNYDANGNLIESVESFQTKVINALFGNDIASAMYKQGLKDGKITHVKKIAGQESTKKSTGAPPLQSKPANLQDAIGEAILKTK